MRSRNNVAGILLIVLGALFLLNEFDVFRWASFSKLWPLVLVAIGISMLVPRNRA